MHAAARGGTTDTRLVMATERAMRAEQEERGHVQPTHLHWEAHASTWGPGPAAGRRSEHLRYRVQRELMLDGMSPVQIAGGSHVNEWASAQPTGRHSDYLRQSSNRCAVYTELIAQIRNAPSPGSAMAGRRIRLLCSLLPGHPPPPKISMELRRLCAEIKANPDDSQPAVIQSTTYLEEVLDGWRYRTDTATDTPDADNAGIQGAAPGELTGPATEQCVDNLVPPQLWSTRATAFHEALGGIFGIDLRRNTSDSLTCDPTAEGNSSFVLRTAEGLALVLAQRRQLVATHQSNQQLATRLGQSGSVLEVLFDCVLGGSAAEGDLQQAAASLLSDKLVEMYCMTSPLPLQQQANGKEIPDSSQVPALLILPPLREMLEQPDTGTRVIAFDLLLNVASGISCCVASTHAGHLIAELVPVLSEVLLLLHLLGEEDDSVWSAALDVLLYFGATAEYIPVPMSTRRTAPGMDGGVGLAGLGLMRGSGGTPHRLDPRVLVAMLGRPHLVSSSVESSVVARFLVGLLVAGLRVDTSLHPTAPSVSGHVDKIYLETAGGISVMGRLYAECDCMVSAEMLFAVLYDFASSPSSSAAASHTQLQRIGTGTSSLAEMEEASAFVLELLSHSQIAWCFRRVFGCLLPKTPALFSEQMQRAIGYLSHELAREADEHAYRWKISDVHLGVCQEISAKLRELVLATLAPTESREWEAIMESAMIDTGQLATQHERASNIRRLTVLLESPDVIEQRTGQQLLFRLVYQAYSLAGNGSSSASQGRDVDGEAQDRNQKPWAQVAIDVWCALAAATEPATRRIYIRIAQSLSWQTLLWSSMDEARNVEHVLRELNGWLMRCVDAVEMDCTNLRLIAQTLIEVLWCPTQQQQQHRYTKSMCTPLAQGANGTLASGTLFRFFVSGEVAISKSLASLVDHRILMHICRSCKGEMECDDIRLTAFLLLRDLILSNVEVPPAPPGGAADAPFPREESDLRVELCLLCQDMLLSEDFSRDEVQHNLSSVSTGATGVEIKWSSRGSGRRLWWLVGQSLLDLLLLLEPDAYWKDMGSIVAHAQVCNDLSFLSEPCRTAQEMLRLRRSHHTGESSAPELSPVAGLADAAALLG